MTTTTLTRRATKLASPGSRWRDEAACRQIESDLFFPTAHTQGWKTQTKQAKAVCAGCPVRATCLEWALETGQNSGVWGGLSAGERRGIRRPRETQQERCLRMQPWIEKQLAAGVLQKTIASQLRVDPVLVSKVIRMFEEERAAGVVEVKAA
ncbi:WhiB family transcriptional regulator [Streptomyces sp. AS02]|uniref:WhiB family transcriptional regulator n=1 Tax=Streptomyces sp. AS02 TaxID=2938946 RepID=UPI0027BAE608|nr:WhiB family transcriptional regulator [Streptomyces sp. AS02]